MKEVSIVAKDFGLEEDKAKEIELGFTPSIQSMNELKPEYDKIINSKIDRVVCDNAKQLRLKFVKIRTGTAKIHKSLKAFYLAGGRFVDAWKNKQLAISEEIEAKLLDIELHYVRIEQEKKEKRKKERIKLLEEVENTGESFDLINMEDEEFDLILKGLKAQYKERKEQEEKERQEKERIEEEKRQEEIRIRKENEELKKQQEEQQKKIEKERKEAEERERKLKEEAEALKKEKEEKEKREQERLKALEEAGDKEKAKAYFSALGEMPTFKNKKIEQKVKNILMLIRDVYGE